MISIVGLQGALILKILRGKYPPVTNFYSADVSEIIKRCLTQVSTWACQLGDMLGDANSGTGAQLETTVVH
jgi:hypothetical protein